MVQGNTRLQDVLKAGLVRANETALLYPPGKMPVLGKAVTKAKTTGVKPKPKPKPVVKNDAKAAADKGNGVVKKDAKVAAKAVEEEEPSWLKDAENELAKTKNMGDQTLQKSSEVVKDLVDTYRKGAEARAKALDEARAKAKVCAESRTKAVNDYQQGAEKAALDAIDKLEKQLAATEAARDDLQSASDASLAKLDELKTADGQSSAKVEELTKTIAQLSVEKQSVLDELAALKTACNGARDAEAALNVTKLEALNVEWTTKLRQCEAKNASSGAEAAKQLEDTLALLKLAQQGLLSETNELALTKEENSKAMNKLLLENSKQEELFRKAALAACAALKEVTDSLRI